MMRSESTKALGHPRETKLILGALAVVMIRGSVESGWLSLIVGHFKALSPYEIGIFRISALCSGSVVPKAWANASTSCISKRQTAMSVRH